MNEYDKMWAGFFARLILGVAVLAIAGWEIGSWLWRHVDVTIAWLP